MYFGVVYAIYKLMISRDSSKNSIVWMKNSVTPDHLASLEANCLDLHCFQKNYIHFEKLCAQSMY